MKHIVLTVVLNYIYKLLNKKWKDPNFTIFKVIFEVASAYGGVGLTLGYPGANGGFSQVI